HRTPEHVEDPPQEVTPTPRRALGLRGRQHVGSDLTPCCQATLRLLRCAISLSFPPVFRPIRPGRRKTRSRRAAPRGAFCPATTPTAGVRTCRSAPGSRVRDLAVDIHRELAVTPVA